MSSVASSRSSSRSRKGLPPVASRQAWQKLGSGSSPSSLATSCPTALSVSGAGRSTRASGSVASALIVCLSTPGSGDRAASASSTGSSRSSSETRAESASMPRSRARARTASSRRDLPMPGGPSIRTSRPSPAQASSTTRSSCLSSPSRSSSGLAEPVAVAFAITHTVYRSDRSTCAVRRKFRVQVQGAPRWKPLKRREPSKRGCGETAEEARARGSLRRGADSGTTLRPEGSRWPGPALLGLAGPDLGDRGRARGRSVAAERAEGRDGMKGWGRDGKGARGRRVIWLSVGLTVALIGAGLTPAGATERVNRFAGTCSFEATVSFSPPATNSQQRLRVTTDATGTCSGTLNGQVVSNAPVELHNEVRKVDGSCRYANTTQPGRGTISFADGTTIAHSFEFNWVLTDGVLRFYGARSGSARGHGSFITQRRPLSEIGAQCAGEGVSEVPMDMSLVTESPLVSKRRGN